MLGSDNNFYGAVSHDKGLAENVKHALVLS